MDKLLFYFSLFLFFIWSSSILCKLKPYRHALGAEQKSVVTPWCPQTLQAPLREALWRGWRSAACGRPRGGVLSIPGDSGFGLLAWASVLPNRTGKCLEPKPCFLLISGHPVGVVPTPGPFHRESRLQPVPRLACWLPPRREGTWARCRVSGPRRGFWRGKVLPARTGDRAQCNQASVCYAGLSFWCLCPSTNCLAHSLLQDSVPGQVWTIFLPRTLTQ